jgi:hypothetical protein
MSSLRILLCVFAGYTSVFHGQSGVLFVMGNLFCLHRFLCVSQEQERLPLALDPLYRTLCSLIRKHAFSCPLTAKTRVRTPLAGIEPTLAGPFAVPMGMMVKKHPEDSTRYRRNDSYGAIANRYVEIISIVGA